MQCPNCSCSTKVINSRQKGTRVWRRHECLNGHRFTTWELAEMELNALGPLTDADQELAEFKEELAALIGRWA